MNRICLITRGNAGKKIKETIEKFGKKNILGQTWEIKEDLPVILEKEDISLPDFGNCDLVLSYALHPDVNLLIVETLKNSEKVVLMPYENAPLPPRTFTPGVSRVWETFGRGIKTVLCCSSG
ncbi:MAG: hypothetical protein AYK19_16240 [Theionarchaea archaeon DG-70-1]|nr:MAG: hypothetical protein AYK19_16240 [Theionarchaea archaeon DG-70-1]